jgi:hypothetical protein
MLTLIATSVSATEGQPANAESGSKQSGNGANAGQQSAVAPGKSGSPFGLADAGPFAEQTTVQGKITVDLTGVWLLVARAELAPGKFKTFPQLLQITKGKSGPEFHLLDVQFPDQMEQSQSQANKTLAAWEPSTDTLKLLGKDWSKLPKAKQKTIEEPLYYKIDYLVASPDNYADAFTTRSELTQKVFDGSKVGMKIVEDYKPRELPPDSHVAQLIRRTTFYGVKTEEKDLIKGDITAGFLAAGAGTPLPYQFNGSFAMYRIASR